MSTFTRLLCRSFALRALGFGISALWIIGSISLMYPVLVAAVMSTNSEVETKISTYVPVTTQSSISPCLLGVISILSNWSGNGSLKDGCLNSAELQKAVTMLATDPRCAAVSSVTSTTEGWLQYPAWFNGVLLEAAVTSAANGSGMPIAAIGKLPQPSDIPDAVSMHDYSSRLESQSSATVTYTTADASGVGLDDLLRDDNDYEHLTENACADRVEPTGPLHPRTFLLMWYRADALAALGFASSAPDDWEGLLELLAAHKNAVAAGNQSLPRYGLCVTDNPHCGRAGDVLAAVAASIVQTRGTSQGYVFDLELPPPAAVPLVNSSGWRYAAKIVHKLLSYNAPYTDTVLLSEAFSSTLLEALDCHAVSPYFTAGSCMLTLEWDAALTHMATAAALQPPAMLAVAPLPGSRWVYFAGAGVHDGEPDLGVCNRRICSVSVDHEMLYSPYGMYVNGAVKPELPVKGDVASELASTQTPTKEFVEMESGAVATAEESVTLALRRRPSLLVNRAPYSAFYSAQSRIQFAGMLVTRNASSIAYAEGLKTLLAFRALRQSITDAIRADMGIYAQTESDAQNCTAYAGFGWWTALWRHSTSASASASASASGSNEGADPERLQPLPPAFNISKLTAVGLDSYTARSYLRTLWFVLHHPNAAPDVQSPSIPNWYRWGLGNAAAILRPNATTLSSSPSSSSSSPSATTSEVTAPSSVTEGADGAATATATQQMDVSTAANNLLLEIFLNTVTLAGSLAARTAYVKSITADSMVRQEKKPAKSGLSHRALAGVIIGPQAGVAVMVTAAVALLWLHRRRARRHRDLMGRVRAPRVGPDTTLLITDVQNSTGLWEALPVETMDCAMRIHNTCIRQAFEKYDGYESATEGDSFIVAFHFPASATAFAASCQLALLEADWPPELLRHPDGAIVLVEPRDPTSAPIGAMSPPMPALTLLPKPEAMPTTASMLASPSGVPQLPLQRVSTAGLPVPEPMTQPSTPRKYQQQQQEHLAPDPPPAAASSTRGASAGFLFRSTALLVQPRRSRSSSQVQLPPVGSPPSRRPSWSNVHNFLATAAFNQSGALVNPPVSATGATVAAGACGAFMPVGPYLQAQPMQLLPPPPTQQAAHPYSVMLQQLAVLMRPVSARASRMTMGSAPAAASTPTFRSHTSSGIAVGGETRSLMCGDPLLPGSPATTILATRVSASGAGVGIDVGVGFRGGAKLAVQPARLQEDPDEPTPPLRSQKLQDGTGVVSHIEASTTVAAPVMKDRTRLDGLQQDSGDDLALSGSILNSFNNANSTNLDSSTSDGGGSCTWQELLMASFRAAATMTTARASLLSFASATVATPIQRDRDQAGIQMPDGRIVAFRGLRVRMGFHSGLNSSNHVGFNGVSSAYQYSGDFAEITRLVSESAPGGLVVMSGPAFDRLRHCVEKGAWGAGSNGSSSFGGTSLKEIKVVYAGHHLLKTSPVVTIGGGTSAGGAVSGCGSDNVNSGTGDGLCTFGCRTTDRMPSCKTRTFAPSPLGQKPSGRRLYPPGTGVWYDPSLATEVLYDTCNCSVTITAPDAQVSTAVTGHGGGGDGEMGGSVTTSAALPPPSLTFQSMPVDASQPHLSEPEDFGASPPELKDARVIPTMTMLVAPPPAFPSLSANSPLQATFDVPSTTLTNQETAASRSPGTQAQPTDTPTVMQRSSLAQWLAPKHLPLMMAPMAPVMPAPPPPTSSPVQSQEIPTMIRSLRETRVVLPRRFKCFARLGHPYAISMPAVIDASRHDVLPTMPQPLYLAVPSGLLCRLALLPPLRSRWVSQLSSLDAPTGFVTVAFLKVVGASTLLAELPAGVALAALEQCQKLVSGLLGAAEGYLVEGCGDGLVVAAFGAPTAAVEWALDCMDGLKRLDWDPVLLSHELCAEQVDPTLSTLSKPQPPPAATMRAGGASTAASAVATTSAFTGPGPGPGPGPGAGSSSIQQGGNIIAVPAAAAARQSISSSNNAGALLALERCQNGLRHSTCNITTTSTNHKSNSGKSWSADGLFTRRGGAAAGTVVGTTTQLNRGLRIKVGLAIGVAAHSLNERSGRLSYRGKLMNRAARLAGIASAGQVLCSLSVWEACEAADPMEFQTRVCGSFLGPMQLKGIREPLHVVQCTRETTAALLATLGPAA